MHKKKLSLLFIFSIFFMGIIFGIYFINKLPTILGYTNEKVTQYEGIVNLCTLAFSSISFVSVLILIAQIRGEHEKSRREKACELLLEWTEKRNKEMFYAKNIVETFNIKQCRKLYLEEEFELDASICSDIINFFDIQTQTASSNNLSKTAVRQLKHFVTLYLNLLESILVAWQYSIADREIIENEFSSFYSPKEGHNFLQNYRIACGNEDKFPAIELFCMQIETRRKESIREKGNVA